MHPSIEFLAKFRPDGPWTLTAIPVEGGRAATASFTNQQADKVEKWIDRVGEKNNIYFSVNPPTELVDKKASREDIAFVDYLHVDVDPRAGESLEEEQNRILTTLQKFSPAPTCIIFSGGGYQAFWKLDAPLPINGSLPAAEEAKRYNMQLEILLGGDNCHNIDRIMRLPGTMNRPNKKKRSKGRKEVMAALVYFNQDISYPITKFTAAQPIQNSKTKGFHSNAAEAAPQVSGNIQRLSSVDELPDTVKPWVKVLIVQGNDPDEPTRWPSRSERLFCVCCELIRAGVPDDIIFSIITDPDFRISASVIELGSRAEAYALRQIRQAKEQAVDPSLRELNEKHAVVESIGGKCRVISIEWDHAFGRPTISKQGFEDFRNRYCNRRVQVGTDKKGNAEYMPLGKWWLQHPMRTQYTTIEFLPGQEIPGCYNLWQGFTCEARPGECRLFLEHVHDVICGGDDYHYDYLIKWLASAVQNPAEVGCTAVVLRGKQGTGKGFFVNTIGKLFGQHYLHITNPKHLVGNFNAHLRDCVLLFADEAFYAGDKKNEAVLKALITERHLMIEPKGIDSELRSNFIHLIMASNSEWVVPAAMDDRRFFVLDVSDRFKEDTTHFGQIQAQLNNGGYEALLHHLMSLDLSDFNVRMAPKTEALHDQKELNLSPEEAWWYDKLQEGRILGRHEDWETTVPKDVMFIDFVNFVKVYMGNYMNRCSKHRFSKFLNRICPVGYPKVKQIRISPEPDSPELGLNFNTKPTCFEFPSLAECRKRWEDVIGFESKWQHVEKTIERPPF